MSSILHITPHFAPARCGVSDYTACWKALLEPELSVFIAALSDKFNPGIFEDAGLLRMGSDQPLNNRLGKLSRLLDSLKFNAIVIHYVPHGYKPNGLPFWLLKLAPLLTKTALPITLVAHEIWTGGQGKSFRIRLKGFLQRKFFVLLARRLHYPSMITTSAFTASQLQREGLVANGCPVFSNMGYEVAATANLPVLSAGAKTHILVLMFGSIPPDAAFSEISAFLALLRKRYQKPLRLLHAGYAGAGSLKSFASFCAGLGQAFDLLGPLPAPDINALMLSCHWGLSTYPLQLWSKSGSIAAMLANGLPVAVLGKLPHVPDPALETLPAGILPWPMLLHKQNQDFVALYQRNEPNHEGYNRNIANRLYAFSGIGSFQQNGHQPLPSLSVVITVYRCWPQAEECIRHLMVQPGLEQKAELILINDDPGNPVPASLLNIQGIAVVNNDKNLGYVTSVNKGVSLANGDCILLLDGDAFLNSSVFPALYLLATDAEARLLVPASRLNNGTLVRRLYPQPHISSLLLGQSFERWWWKVNRAPQVVAHSYAWFFRRSDFIQLGGLDERLNFLEADVEFCMRLQQAYPNSIRLCNSMQVVHEGGANPIRRNQRVVEWYKSRWYILTKHHKVHWQPLSKAFIAIRFSIERGLASLFSLTSAARRAFWLDKAEGRKMLMNDLKNW